MDIGKFLWAVLKFFKIAQVFVRPVKLLKLSELLNLEHGFSSFRVSCSGGGKGTLEVIWSCSPRSSPTWVPPVPECSVLSFPGEEKESLQRPSGYYPPCTFLVLPCRSSWNPRIISPLYSQPFGHSKKHCLRSISHRCSLLKLSMPVLFTTPLDPLSRDWHSWWVFCWMIAMMSVSLLNWTPRVELSITDVT